MRTNEPNGRQTGRRRDTQQCQRQPQCPAAGGAGSIHPGKEQPVHKIHCRKEQGKTQQPGQPVDRLLCQLDGIQIELAFLVGQGGGQVADPRTEARPQPGGNGAVAIVQRQLVGVDGGRVPCRGKTQGTGALQYTESGNVRRLAGKIVYRHLISAGRQCRPGGGKGDLLVGLERTVVPNLQGAAVLTQGSDVGKFVGKILGGQGQCGRSAEQTGHQCGQQDHLQDQHQGKPLVAAQTGDTLLHDFCPHPPVVQPSQIMTLALRMEESSTVAM